ncbi:MAG: YbaK/EbsC family protein [Planctomycetes bacterium]|nr:YbaK/EbsC family protein [Planctomycetota bacterium]
MQVVEFLKANKVKFQLRHHPAMFTAQEVAAAEHITGEEVAKVVIVRADGRFAMFVLPATCVLDFKDAARLLAARDVRLATEAEMEKLFPDCQVGAQPPFGTEYGVETYVEKRLASDPEILIPAGTHEDSVLLAWPDYERLAKPKVAAFATHTA